MTANAFANARSAGVAFKQNNLERESDMAKFIIQPHGRLNDWVAHEKGYFREEGLDYELNVEGSPKNTPRLAALDSPVALGDSRFGMPKGADARARTRAMSVVPVIGRSTRLRKLKKV